MKSIEKHEDSIYTDQVKELAAIGAAIASNCETCFRFHFDKAAKLGLSRQDMALAVETAKMVKASPAQSIALLADRTLGAGNPESTSRK